MRKITKSLLTLALLVLAVGSVNAGKLHADLSKLGNGPESTWDGATNTITWKALSNNMVSNFNFAAGNYSSWKKIVVKVASLNNAIGVRIQIRANGKEKTKPFNGTGTISVSLADYGFDPGDLNSVEWIRMLGSGNYDGETHTINETTPASAVIEEVYLEGPDILSQKERIEAPTGTTDVKDLTGTNTGWATSVTYPKEFAAGGNVFGDGNGDKESTHVNIEGYDYICFYVTHAPANSAGLRIWIWDGEAGGAGSVVTLYAYPIADYATATYTTSTKINAGVGTYVARVSGYKYLKGVKAASDWSSPASVVSMAYMCTGAPVAYTGSGKFDVVGEEALTDPSTVCVDVTALSGSGLTYDAVNPNCLFIANAGQLTNTKNVIVNGVCDNLELTDGNYPFKTYSDFTATNVSYNREFKDGKFSTVCLPFALTEDDLKAISGGFYDLTGVSISGKDFTYAPIATGTTAYRPYVFEPSGNGQLLTGFTNKLIPATPETCTGATVEGYTMTGVLTGSSDVAADNPGKTVYGWSGNDGNEGVLVKVGTGVAINPFRAYVVYEGAAPSPEMLYVHFDNDSVTGINEVSETKKALNRDGKYIKNGQIMIVKNGVKYNAVGAQVK